MYKLENNVAWTTELKNAFKTGVTKAKIIYGENIEINYDNGLKEIVLEDNRYVPEMGFIGQATAKKVTLTLLDNSQTTNLENKEFSLYIGADYDGQTYYINYGNFIVYDTPQNDSTNGTIKIVAYDYMIKFNQLYQNAINFPCTLKDYLTSICIQAGVPLGTTNFPNDDFIVDSDQFEGKQLREVLQHITKSAFGWARIGQDNKLYLDFSITSDVIERVTINDYKMNGYKKANEHYGPVNRVILGESNISGEEAIIEDASSILEYGEEKLVINDDYFGYTQEKRNQLIQAGSVLFGLTYMPIQQLDLKGTIYLDCTDLIEVEDEDENIITTRAFNHTIKYNGIISDSISTESISKIEQTYENYADVIEKRTEIIVDRDKQTMDSIISNMNYITEDYSQISQTLQNISATVVTINEFQTQMNELIQSIDGTTSSIINSGGNNLFYYAMDFWNTIQENDNYGIEEYSDTDIKQNTISKLGYILKNGNAVQQQVVKNGFYTISFLYKKLNSLAECYVLVNNVRYDLEAETLDTWQEEIISIYVDTNVFDFEIISDTDDGFKIADLMVNAGTEKEVWSQNANEVLTDTVKIGKGIQIESSVSNTYTRIDADGNRTYNRTTNEVVSEQTDKGIKTNELEVRGQATINKLLIEEIDNQVWIAGIGG